MLSALYHGKNKQSECVQKFSFQKMFWIRKSSSPGEIAKKKKIK